jgi:uncharacterized protein DUF1194
VATDKHIATTFVLALGFILTALVVAATEPAETADVALVLAIDVSGSVSKNRFELQRQGIAEALTSQGFGAAIHDEVIEIAIIEWSENQEVVVPWVVVRKQSDVGPIVDLLMTKARTMWGLTNPKGALAYADGLFATAPLIPTRKVVDISGDGSDNVMGGGPAVTNEVRDAVISHDVTINGLPIITDEEKDIDVWYKDHLIGGPGHFMIVASQPDDFANALRLKMALEVASATPR